MPDDLYWKDIVGWSEGQADRLRRLSRGERVNDLDWENVIDEVESVGRSELKTVKSLLTRAIGHAMKIHRWPDDQAVPHWRAEIAVFLRDARQSMDPGMGQRLDIAGLFGDALGDLEGIEFPSPARPLPTGITLEPREVREKRLSPDDLLARLTGP